MTLMLLTAGGANGGRPERRAGDRRRTEVKRIGSSGARTMRMDGADMTRAAEHERGEGQCHHTLMWRVPDGSCHEGTTPKIGGSMIFVESIEIAPVGTEVLISLVPREEDPVDQELVQGMVVWHCPFGDQFGKQSGFGVLLRKQRLNG